MNGIRQGWLVARREIRERSRSRTFLASLVLMAVAVAGVLIIPALLKPGGGTRDVGLTGPAPAALAAVQDRTDVISFAYQPPTLSELFRQVVAA